jgi:methylthioribose-1-phosphate isomerase
VDVPKALWWEGDAERGHLVLLDQRRLPADRVERACADVEDTFEAIRTLAVRGAPAIGVAAAYGLVLGLRGRDTTDGAGVLAAARAAAGRLNASRPTAVNLGWALARMLRVAEAHAGLDADALRGRLLAEARAIQDEDERMCAAIGRHGAARFPAAARVVTHCNTGALATAGIGTALGAIYTAHAAGRLAMVYACETRPLLQGSRLTAWELEQAGIPVTLVSDSMAGALLARGGVDLAITGADRIARNGDAANKIGTYGLAVLAREHGVPFYVAAPSSTFDLRLASGAEIPIEERAPEELRTCGGVPSAPASVQVWNPAFDVTPAALIRGIVTEEGVIEPVTEAGVLEMLG